jgi:uncharacterized membrane protein
MNATPLARLFALATLAAAAASPAWADTQAAGTRAEVKAETLAAMKAGLIVSGEMMPTPTATPTTRSREERKAETMDAIQHKQTMQPGEAA